MAYDPGALDAALSAALGHSPDLIDELRAAFIDSADAHVARLHAASTDAVAWSATALRLRSLGASFGATRLADAASAAAESPCGDRAALARINRALMALRRD